MGSVFCTSVLLLISASYNNDNLIYGFSTSPWLRNHGSVGFYHNKNNKVGDPQQRLFMNADSVADDEVIERIDNNNESDNEMSFDELGLYPTVLSAIRSHPDWIEPTAVQSLAIPQLAAAEEEEDDEQQHQSVWCLAPTGSGKTAAFCLPLLHNLAKDARVRTNEQQKKGTAPVDEISSLILCPTRELAEQIGDVLSSLVHNMSGQKEWNVVTLYGGVPRQPQIVELADCARRGQPIDIVVATPGRLVDVLQYYSGDQRSSDDALERRVLEAMDAKGGGDGTLTLEQINKLKLDRTDDDGREKLPSLLDNLKYLVIDEADRILGRAFESELDMVLELLPRELQTWLFSATFPKQIEPRVDNVLRRIGGDNPSPPLRISCMNEDRIANDADDVSSNLSKKLVSVQKHTRIDQVEAASTIDLLTIRIQKRDRTQALRSILESQRELDRVLVFVSTRYAAEHVSRKLRRAGIRSAELHGKLDQDARARRLRDLKTGKIRVLLATDVASRGIDIAGLPAVFNYDLPRSTADFVHRIGRTGRAKKKGAAITFCTPESESHLDLIEKRHLSKPARRQVLDDFTIDEELWKIEADAARMIVPGADPSEKGLAHDKMFGGVKGRRKSKKDKLREAAAAAATGNTHY